ncbi:MAG: 3-dehydroquinate dehydratase [Clostridiales bacterium]|nr:3-dehydroquinate dehydratase [Clostridiales bacterium]
MKILLLNGVNLNMLGKRDSRFYGTDTLAQLEEKLTKYAAELGVTLTCAQSNIEGELVNILQQTDCDAVVFNAGAYSHYSYALYDCIECISVPVAEVHMSNIYEREQFRHNDVLADVCVARFYGKGIDSYIEAIDYFVKKI